MGSSFLALNHLYRIIPIKMSETEVKTDAPTAEEIKGTKRSAEDEIDAAKRKKVRAKKTLTKRQKEKKVRKRKMVRVKKKKRGMTKLYYGHPTSSFRTTYTKYATSSSSLLSKSKKRSTATVRKKNSSNDDP